MSNDGHEALLGDANGQEKPTDIASGMPLIVTAADRRARAVYYSFSLLGIGCLILLIVILVESHKWRNTVATESKAWRDLMQKFEDDLARQFSAANNPEL